jgi:8-oxo-dGTP pyrophosphatase MutT (NUDIX family)
VRGLLRFGFKVAATLRRWYWFVFRPTTSGVKCVVEHDGRWLMIRTTYGKGLWTHPGGGVGRGEAPEDAARREVAEELGITLSTVTPIGDYFSDREYKRDTVYCFIARVDAPRFEIAPAEVAEARWIDPHQLPREHDSSVDRIVAMLAATPERTGEGPG